MFPESHRLRSKKGSRIYAQRKAIVEPVNGQIKEAKGLRRFLLRGVVQVQAITTSVTGGRIGMRGSD
ncbi:transposase [Synechococcus sp. Tobar12-5m-g]|uniref:transposase n=1 Tax=unclassified Synechococcus TaxID=2626047 RepID=UPI0020CE9FF4|nr:MULTISPECIES: transposase [unclassified Synechococcus]MCP9773848.1 transposase [Synechococcus sp. Tobar12-5m-g]MCP9874898.1 transposase [Synechococcus sp. Cruz CV-v-12]